MRDHFLYEKFYDFHCGRPFPDHFEPRGCGPHGHGRHGPGPHRHGPFTHGPHEHGPFRHGPHPHSPRDRFGCHGPHREFNFFGPRGFDPWDRFRHFGGPGHFDRPGRPGHFDRPAPGFFGRGGCCDRRRDGCEGSRGRGHGKPKNAEEQTFLFRGVVIEQDKRPNSV